MIFWQWEQPCLWKQVFRYSFRNRVIHCIVEYLRLFLGQLSKIILLGLSFETHVFFFFPNVNSLACESARAHMHYRFVPYTALCLCAFPAESSSNSSRPLVRSPGGTMSHNGQKTDETSIPWLPVFRCASGKGGGTVPWRGVGLKCMDNRSLGAQSEGQDSNKKALHRLCSPFQTTPCLTGHIGGD